MPDPRTAEERRCVNCGHEIGAHFCAYAYNGDLRETCGCDAALAAEPVPAPLDDALRQARDRMQSAFDLLHPGDLTADEREGIAQNLWFGIEEAAKALGEPSWYDNPSWSATPPERKGDDA